VYISTRVETMGPLEVCIPIRSARSSAWWNALRMKKKFGWKLGID